MPSSVVRRARRTLRPLPSKFDILSAQLGAQLRGIVNAEAGLRHGLPSLQAPADPEARQVLPERQAPSVVQKVRLTSSKGPFT